jgi:hypothetical protein
MGRRFRDVYGAGPVHLVALVATFALAGWAIIQAFGEADPLSFAIWLVGGIVAHDLLLLPLYSLLGLVAYRGLRVATGERIRVAALNHLRFPALLSGVLLVVWLPLILGLSAERFRASTGVSSDGYLERWLLITAAAFLVSALLFAVRVRRAAR